jgi:FkbH-like protein
LVEPVRLVIWDLDETFWKGTLTEGGIELIPRHGELVRLLAGRGIVSSICSKNDHAAVERVLRDAGIWDLFVLPSVNWEPKGPRLTALIESLQLRPASVLFIDDNHLNREEAQHALPELQVSDEGIIPSIADSPAFAGKADPELSRLRQYKSLELRKFDAAAATHDATGFLRASGIVVSIEHDVAAHLDRAVELINRTNQLNFVKSRLAEDPQGAREELSALLAQHDILAGLVRVTDRYGDHGYCGLYILKHKRLLQFAFSCRILGLGVERWLYRRLGSPAIQISEPVSAQLIVDEPPIDWITLTDSPLSQPDPAAIQGSIFARGGCDLKAVGHYFNVGAFRFTGEFNLGRHYSDMRIDHSMFLRYAITGLPPGGLQACQRLGYEESDFRTALHEERPGKRIWLLSFFTDAAFALYRHRRSGVMVPFMLRRWPDQTADVRHVTLEQLPAEAHAIHESVLAEPLAYLRHQFDYLGLISESQFKENLRIVLDSAPPGTRVFLLTANEQLQDPVEPVRHHSLEFKALNRWMRGVARWRRHVTVLDVRHFIESDAEVHNWGHFNRMVYFRIYRELERRIGR